MLQIIFGGTLPSIVSATPWAFDPDTGKATITGAIFDLPAVAIVMIITCILISGIKESAFLNNAIVIFKVAVVLFVILAGSAYVDSRNFSPFMPYGYFGLSFFGYTAVGQSDSGGNAVGVLAGASVVFFAYIGFDAVTTNAEECKDPQTDLPIGTETEM